MKVIDGGFGPMHDGALVLDPRNLPELMRRSGLGRCQVTAVLTPEHFAVSTEAGVDHDDVAARAGLVDSPVAAGSLAAWRRGERTVHLSASADGLEVSLFSATGNDREEHPGAASEMAAFIRTHPKVRAAYGGEPSIAVAARDEDFLILWEFREGEFDVSRAGQDGHGMRFRP